MLPVISIISPKNIYAEVHSTTSPYFETADTINFDKNIDSDVVLVGNEVNVNGEIKGDLFILAEKATINTRIDGNARVMAIDTTISNYIDGSVFFVTKNLSITPTGDIEKDVYGYTQNISHQGRIGRNLNLGGSPSANIDLSGKIVGDLTYSDSRPNLTETAIIQGNSYKIPNPLTSGYSQKDSREYMIFSKLFHSLFLVIIAGFIIATKKKYFTESLEKYPTDIVKKILSGVGLFIILVLLMIMLIFMFFGVPLAIGVFGFLIVTYYLSFIWASAYLSKRLFSKELLDHNSFSSK